MKQLIWVIFKPEGVGPVPKFVKFIVIFKGKSIFEQTALFLEILKTKKKQNIGGKNYDHFTHFLSKHSFWALSSSSGWNISDSPSDILKLTTQRDKPKECLFLLIQTISEIHEFTQKWIYLYFYKSRSANYPLISNNLESLTHTHNL